MTEEEYFRKNYPDSCYGDKPLSPYWDLFQYGVEFGERQSEKKIADLEKENKKLDRALITSTKNNIERQKIIDSLQAEKEKEKIQIIANCSDEEEGLRRKIFKLEQQIEKYIEGNKKLQKVIYEDTIYIGKLKEQIEKMKCCANCDHYRWSNGEDWCNDHYGQPVYDEECKGKWKLRG